MEATEERFYEADDQTYESSEPSALPVQFENIQTELKAISHWVLWRYEERSGKWTKPPYQPNGSYASSTDRGTWSSYEVVKKAYKNGGFDGVGFVLTDGLGIVRVDLDHCVDENGTIIDNLLIVDAIKSYTEISPSGTGVRIFAKGDIPTEGKKREENEIYKSGRYLTITGHNLNNLGIENRNDAITCIYDYIANSETPTEKREKKGKKENFQWESEYTLTAEVEARFNKLIVAHSVFAGVFYKLAADCKDRSVHEFRICCLLAEHGFDCNEITGIMNERLPREGSKWHSRQDSYNKKTVENAIDAVNSTMNDSGCTINITEVRDLNKQVELAIDAMIEYNSPPTIFKQAGNLVRLVEPNSGEYAIERLSIPALQLLLSTSANWMRTDKQGVTDHTYPPKPVVEAISGLGIWEGIPWLMGVSNTPIVTPSSEIVTRQGFDEKTGFYYAPPAGFVLPPIPDNPTQQDAMEAAKWLDTELFCDFPFVDTASRTNMMAMLITPVVRSMIDGCTPLMLIDKPKAGTGATKLLNLVSLVATGRSADLNKDPGSEEEWRKTLHSMLLSGRPFHAFDNVDAELSSSSLSQCLTAKSLSGRILGQSKEVSVPNRANWMATGNGMRVAGDMVRRICLIQLDAKMAEPWTRSVFRHSDLEQWVVDHREEILVKIYTMIRAWVVAGKPELNTVTIGSFEEWVSKVGSIINFAGRNEFMGNYLLSKELSAIDNEWEPFITAFNEMFGEEHVRASRVFEWLDHNTEVADILPKEIAAAMGGKGGARTIGRVLLVAPIKKHAP
jgi:hypothetical protein